VRLPLLLALLLLSTAASAQVIHIQPHDNVYYNDTVNILGLMGWTENITWWASNHDPAVDDPDHLITIENFTAFKITRDLEPGYWFQWYGHGERNPTVVFNLVARDRPANLVPTPTPTPVSGVLLPSVKAQAQAAPIADYLVARYDTFSYDCGGKCKVWMFGPRQQVLGQDTDGVFTLNPMNLYAGTYALLAQYPDANGVYEIYSQGDYLNSTWKDVPAVEVRGYAPSVVKDKLMSLLVDDEHFHGRVEEKKVIVQEPHIDITGLDETDSGSVVATGTTNLAKGDIVTVVFDDDRVFLAGDRVKMTFTTNATGDHPGAYRIWQATLRVNLQKLSVGDHFIAAYPPQGEKTTVPFYLSQVFKPFEPPKATLTYLNNSPFFPTPTPVIIQTTVTQYVDKIVEKTVIVNITPDYDQLNRMQWANLSGAIMTVTLYLSGFGLVGAMGFIGWKKGVPGKLVSRLRLPTRGAPVEKKDKYVFGEEL